MKVTAVSMPWRATPPLVFLLMIPLLAVGLEVRLPDARLDMAAMKPSGALAKLDGALLKVSLEFEDHLRTAPGAPFRPRNPFLRIARGRILIDARAATDAGTLLSDLNRLGLDKGSRFGDTVSGWLPIGVVRKAAALGSLRALSASISMTNAGSVMSEGDAAQRSDLARTLHSLTGAGVKVGVLSDSYNQQGGAAADVTSGDLPSDVQVLDDSANCGDDLYPAPCTDEGRAMLQIVHDVAPGAALAFHTAYNGFAGFANGIVDLANAGAQVIVDDVMYLSEPMFMDGVIAQAVDQVKGMGVAYFSAAGNAGRNSYEHAYVNSGEQLYIDLGLGFLIPAGPMHDFDPGPAKDTAQAYTIPAGQCAIFSVQWDSPFGSEAAGTGTQNDLDIWLLDDSESVLVACDAHENIPTGEPVEAMQFCNDGIYVPTDPPVFKLVIVLWEGAEPGLMKTVAFGSASIDEHATNSSTLYGHANAAGAEAVGAAYYLDTPAFGTSPPQLEYFSSAGGTPILFAPSGTRLATPDVRMKPEVVAPDGVSTTFFYPLSDRNGDDHPDFSGTSAAAPHAAGVAALMVEANPSASPDALQAALESTATNMAAIGFDYDSGYGLIQADNAVEAIADGETNLPSNSLHVGDLDGTSVNAGKTWSAQVTATVHDTNHAPVTGATVSGSWIGAAGGSAECVTGAGGTCTVNSTDLSKKDPSVVFVVGSVVGALPYMPNNDHDPDGDSSGKTIQVNKDGSASDPANQPPVASFTYDCTGTACTFDASGSLDPDGSIVSCRWTLGDGATESGVTPTHTYSGDGSYHVALIVVDNGDASSTASQDLTIGNGIILNASGYKVKGVQQADLSWTGTDTPVDVYRDEAQIASDVADGSYTDPIGQKGGGTYTYRVCETGTSSRCSNEAVVVF
jgi:hypothetical protein